MSSVRAQKTKGQLSHFRWPREGESKVQVIGGILAMRRAAFPDYAQREAR